MRTDLEQARHILETGDYTCVLCKGDTVHTATARGVKPLLSWLDEGLDVTYFSAADRVVGKATAYLYCLLGVKAVYAHVMSKAAAGVLIGHGIAVLWDKQVDAIINRQGNGPCPFEAAVWDIDDPAEALAAIRGKLKSMQ